MEFWIVYKTINLVNGKIYIGVHQTEKPYEFDGYLGSGTLLKKAINKYGEDSFYRETLFVFDSSDEAFDKEKEIVTLDFVEKNMTYNLSGGGLGGRDFSEEHCNHISESRQGKFKGEQNFFYGKHHTEETKRKMRENHWDMTGENHPRYGVPMSKETKLKLSLLNKGENNPLYGKHHSEETKRKCSIVKGMTSDVIAKRRLDVKNDSQSWGMYVRLGRKWGVCPSASRKFVRKYALDLINFQKKGD